MKFGVVPLFCKGKPTTPISKGVHNHASEVSFKALIYHLYLPISLRVACREVQLISTLNGEQCMPKFADEH